MPAALMGFQSSVTTDTNRHACALHRHIHIKFKIVITAMKTKNSPLRSRIMRTWGEGTEATDREVKKGFFQEGI